MDTKLRQRSFITTTTATSSSNYFPVRSGYSGIFNHNLLQPTRPSVITRGFVTTAAKSLPYLGVVRDSPYGTGQGQNQTKNEMGGLVSLFSALPVVGVVQKFISSFFTSAKKSDTQEKHEDCKTLEPLSEKALLHQSSISNYIKNQMCDKSTCDNSVESSNRPDQENSVSSACIKSRPNYSLNHFYNHNKSKMGPKNRLEKQRHNIQCDISEDFGGLAITSSDDEEDYFDPINKDTHFASFEIGCNEIAPKLTVIYKSSPESESSFLSKSFIFSMDDFPLIPECKKQNRLKLAERPKMASPKRTAGCYRRQHSLEQTDDEFVVFDHDSVKNTPTCSSTGTPSLKSLLINRLKCGGRRRQISECSDDSVVIFFESDGEPQSDCWSETDVSEAEEAEESDEDEDTVDTMECNQQIDSGFDEHEKKVTQISQSGLPF